MPEIQEQVPVESWTETIQDTKAQLADMYLTFLDQQKGGILATSSWLGVNLNPLKKTAMDYLLSEGVTKKQKFLSKIWESIKKKIIEKVSWWTMLAYDKVSLNKMKALITQYKDDQNKLQELMSQIAEGTDPTIAPETTAEATRPINVVPPATIVAAWAAGIESTETISDRRKAVVTNMGAILAVDKKHPIRYDWWGHLSTKKWLDCGGLIVYASNHAWLKLGGNGRELFQKFPSKKLEVDDKGAITTDTSNFQEWDVLIFDALDSRYYDTPGHRKWMHPIQGTEGQTIHPHHFAFIKSFDRARGIVKIVESNGSQGVTESECSISSWLNKKGKEKSALHAIHVDYDKLEKLNPAAMAKLEVLPWAALAA